MFKSALTGTNVGEGEPVTSMMAVCEIGGSGHTFQEHNRRRGISQNVKLPKPFGHLLESLRDWRKTLAAEKTEMIQFRKAIVTMVAGVTIVALCTVAFVRVSDRIIQEKTALIDQSRGKMTLDDVRKELWLFSEARLEDRVAEGWSNNLGVEVGSVYLFTFLGYWLVIQVMLDSDGLVVFAFDD